MNGLAGKIAVITGGTQGLGAAIARLFADRGASGIVTCGRSVAKGQAKAQEIQDATGAKVVFVAADLGMVQDCRAVIAKADAEFGRVDVLVNAAGITDRGTIIDTSPELFDMIFNAGNDKNHASRKDRGQYRQYLLNVVQSRPAVHRGLLFVKRCSGNAYGKHGLRGYAQSYPRQRAEHRMDGHRR